MSSSPSTTIPRLLLSARDAAQALGGISTRHLWSLTQPRGPIASVRIGCRVLYDPRDLTAYIDGQKEGAE